tara:strand:+ start:62 stop:328 length:267 start_codon:yes stop_codon:yes gene_type:complete
MSKTKLTIWYHSASPPQIIGRHNNGCFVGNYDGLHKTLMTANNLARPWRSQVITQDYEGDYHLFQTDKHWRDYPSKDTFAASYETIKV